MPKSRKISHGTVDRFSRALCAVLAGNAEAQAALRWPLFAGRWLARARLLMLSWASCGLPHGATLRDAALNANRSGTR